MSAILPGLIGGLIGGLITVLSWFVTDRQRRFDSQRTRLAEYVENQIFELYAPLYVLAETDRNNRRLRNEVSERVGADRRVEAYSRITDSYVHPKQKEIFALLQSKWYLLEDDTPPSFSQVIDHCTQALTLYELDKSGLGHLIDIPASRMPDTFVEDVQKALSQLRAKYSALMGIRIENVRSVLTTPPLKKVPHGVNGSLEL